jgi:predicted GIY-YIG superfamily endonuclease
MRNGYAYILTNKPYGTFYIGVTNDMSGRLDDAHRRDVASAFTKKYGLPRLVYYETPYLVIGGDSTRNEYQNMEARLENRIDSKNEYRFERAGLYIDVSLSRADARGMGGRVTPGHDGVEFSANSLQYSRHPP